MSRCQRPPAAVPQAPLMARQRGLRGGGVLGDQLRERRDRLRCRLCSLGEKEDRGLDQPLKRYASSARGIDHREAA
eukprot:1043424-Pleurochrysis_carterae.AAC.4